MHKLFSIFFILCSFISAYASEQCAQCDEVEELPELPAPSYPYLSWDEEGLAVRSVDDFFVFRMTGLLQVDARAVVPDHVARGANNFFVRRARLIFDGTVGNGFSYRMTPDFSLGRETRLFDAWVQYDYSDTLGFRLGKTRPPLGLERLEQEGNLKFIQRGLPSNLVPIRDIGFMICGKLMDKRLEYEVGIFNGAPDLGLSSFDSNNAKDIDARFFCFPFKNSCWPQLEQFAFGCAGSWGVHSTVDLIDGPELPIYFTPATLIFFYYRPTCVADGAQWRIAPQGYWYYGPWGLLWEYIVSSLKVKNRIDDHPQRQITNRAWQIQLSYELTGEENSFGRIIPLTTFDWCAGTWGAIELVARYEEMYIDPDAFPIFVDPFVAAQSVRSGGVGVNWYLNLFVKLSADYEVSTFKKGAHSGDHLRNRPVEQVLFLQAQMRF